MGNDPSKRSCHQLIQEERLGVAADNLAGAMRVVRVQPDVLSIAECHNDTTGHRNGKKNKNVGWKNSSRSRDKWFVKHSSIFLEDVASNWGVNRLWHPLNTSLSTGLGFNSH